MIPADPGPLTGVHMLSSLEAMQAATTLQQYIVEQVAGDKRAAEYHHAGHKYHMTVQDWETNYDKLEQLVAIQTSDGNAVDAYMVGMANGLLLARHAMIGATGDVGYLDVPVTAPKSNREDALNRQIMQLMRDNRALAEERNNACDERDKAINTALGEREDRVELLINERDAARKEVHYLRTQRDAAMEAYTELHLKLVPPPVLWPSNVEPPTETARICNPMDPRWAAVPSGIVDWRYDERTLPQMAFIIGKLQEMVRVNINTIQEKYNEGVRDGQTEARQELAMMASATDYKLLDILKRKKVHLRVRDGEEHGSRTVTLVPLYVAINDDTTKPYNTLAIVGTLPSEKFVSYTTNQIASWAVDGEAPKA